MSNLNQVQKGYLKTVVNQKQAKKIKRQFKIVNSESVELNNIQKNFIKTIDSEFVKNELINLFREANVKLN
ncbi:hypothetical protein ACFX5E_02505 [Flavobacterium sp. LS2P90]|jgi:hypothetical protein|uniref:Uncharacterized protein n=1 Tax=Flavobacterium xylosi TaxID=3230415 RepID=A0ABW6HSH2_9FLAO